MYEHSSCQSYGKYVFKPGFSNNYIVYLMRSDPIHVSISALQGASSAQELEDLDEEDLLKREYLSRTLMVATGNSQLDLKLIVPADVVKQGTYKLAVVLASPYQPGGKQGG